MSSPSEQNERAEAYCYTHTGATPYSLAAARVVAVVELVRQRFRVERVKDPLGSG